MIFIGCRWLPQVFFDIFTGFTTTTNNFTASDQQPTTASWIADKMSKKEGQTKVSDAPAWRNMFFSGDDDGNHLW